MGSTSSNGNALGSQLHKNHVVNPERCILLHPGFRCLSIGFAYWHRCNGHDDTATCECKEIREGNGLYLDSLKGSFDGQNYAEHKQPLEAVGTAYYEPYQRVFVDEIPLDAANMK